jgi:hypothetical protein
MTDLVFGGKKIRFEKRGDRVWVSLTDMAQATGKLVGNWNQLDGTTKYLSKLEAVIGIPITETNQGGIPEKQGTWAIKQVAIKFACWCNVDFEIWVTEQIDTLLTEGTVSIAPQQPQLPPSDVRLTNLVGALKDLGIDLTNPRFQQGLQDLALDMLGVGNPALKAEDSEVWCGVAERAEQLGYPVGLVVEKRVSLGMAIARVDLIKKKEDRLCNGTMRKINVYLVNEDLDLAIETYFDELTN